jgi:transcriptional regulator with XRE-family HTH domain
MLVTATLGIEGRTDRRRDELASFLRSRRERITPADVGMPPGPRRRTPGLRREEVAQLAGVGVTWYTWLEQGRPINVSAQVLGAVARTLRLDAGERAHLYRLAEVPQSPADAVGGLEAPSGLDAILCALNPLPASVANGRGDILAWNHTYATLFPGIVSQPAPERNSLWCLFTQVPDRGRMVNLEEQAPESVAILRYRYSQHLNDPAWQHFIDRLCAASPLFARHWATHNVATPRACNKRFDYPGIGEVALITTNLDLADHPGTRLTVATPVDEASRKHLDQVLQLGPWPGSAD